MPGVFRKLNLKEEREIVVIDAPQSFETELAELEGVSVLRHPEQAAGIRFCLAFVTRQQDVDRIAQAVTARAQGDALLWFAYPKTSSKKYSCDFNRDTGWRVLGEAGFEPVRQVAIDQDWSALRFRRVQYIKSLKRDPKRAGSPAAASDAVEERFTVGINPG